MANLVELDSLEILAIIDNELDPISPSPNPTVLQSGGLKEIAQRGGALEPDSLGVQANNLSMSNICCSAHGLSLMITGTKGNRQHTILFDTGPEERAWELNARRLRADIGRIETVQLSHWHRDHSGGMLKVLSMITEARSQAGSEHASLPKVDVDLHPKRPDRRGTRPPEMPVTAMEPDPTLEEIESVGGVVQKHSEAHTVLEDFFLVSGEIPRVTDYEHGLKFGVRYEAEKGYWEDDWKMADERFLMCKIKGKGTVMFTGCSHAGVVNASRHAVELSKGTPLYAVMGGYHLADAGPEHIESTANDLKTLDVKVLLAGHCTGWRAKFKLQQVFPDGCLVPSFVGNKFVL